MRLYTMINLEILAPGEPPSSQPWKHWVYYNPQADILYFGYMSCLSTMIKIMKLGLELPRIAIDLLQRQNCCFTYRNRNFLGVRMSAADWMMHTLHGYHVTDLGHPETHEWPGCKGLKEVFWIDRAGLLGPELEDVDEGVGLELDVGFSEKKTTWDRAERRRALKRLAERIEDEQVLESVGQNKWTGDNKPLFHFARLKYYPSAPKVCEVVFLKYTAKPQVRRISAATRKFAERIRCNVFFAQRFFEGQGDYAIKIMGTRQQVRRVKEEITKMCKKKNRVGGEVATVERAEAKDPYTSQPYDDFDECGFRSYY
jgi:hypothetical protein